MKKLFAFSLLFVLILGGCAAEDPAIVAVDPSTIVPGQGDPVVAIGNSLTAGYFNSGLQLEGQLQGYANLVANQFLEGLSDAAVEVAPGLPPMAMSMPLVGGGGIGGSSGFGPLYVNESGAVTRDPLSAAPEDLLLAAALLQPYANLGVPGALTVDVTTRLSTSPVEGIPLPPNPFFDVVLRNGALPFNQGEPVSSVTSNGTQLGQYLQIIDTIRSTTAITMLWIGNNDILGPAGQGGSAGIAPPEQFEALLTPILDEVEDSGVPMVAIANIPSVTSAPAFTTIAGLLGLNGVDPAALNAEEDDVQLILLSSLGDLFPGGEFDTDYLDPTSGKVLPASETLTGTEVVEIETAIAQYNGVIASQADGRTASGFPWPLVDVNAELASLPPLPGAELNGAFPWTPSGQNPGSGFGLDGVHPSEKGYARVANLFIDAFNGVAAGNVIRAIRGSDIPRVDEASIVNRLGFERAPGAGTAAPIVTPDAVRAFREATFGNR
jgi:hypothetical protein